jgi:hypothetical protein
MLHCEVGLIIVLLLKAFPHFSGLFVMPAPNKCHFWRIIAWTLPAAFPATGQAAPGNARATQIAAASPLVAQARADLRRWVMRIGDPALRRATAAAVLDPATCVRHRAGLDAAGQGAIVDRLIDARLVAAGDRARLVAGVFPPLPDNGGPCPHLPQSFLTAPGGDNAGHHRWPGGLVVHTVFNAHVALALAQGYDRQTGLATDRDAVITAALWHDWAKTLVFQWQADGREFDELTLAGTGAHHILGLAEAMARGLPPRQVAIQACAHGAQAEKVVDWLRAAAIIARIDPEARGYLSRDAQGRPALPEPFARAECLIHFQSDQNWVLAEAAANLADDVLARLAPRFGQDPADDAHYRPAWRNMVLSRLGADRIMLRYQHGGLAAVAADIAALR